MVTAVAAANPNVNLWEQYQEGQAALERSVSNTNRWLAYRDAVRAYGKPNIAKGRAARKLDHALSALICLTPEERQGFLIEAEMAIKELDANRTGNSSSSPQRA
jgi:hypothetical protein